MGSRKKVINKYGKNRMNFGRKSRYNRRGIQGMRTFGRCSHDSCHILKMFVEGVVDGVMINYVII